jgi:hypothetical protein
VCITGSIRGVKSHIGGMTSPITVETEGTVETEIIVETGEQLKQKSQLKQEDS